MKESFITYPLLDKEICTSLLNSFRDETWLDGTSNTHNLSGAVKKNVNLDSSSSKYDPASQVVFKGLESSWEFFSFVQPKQTSTVIFSKTKEGGYYKSHIDHWTNGDFSTTLFLEDPDKYEGGELVFLRSNQEVKIKLPAGWAITYKTGIPHRVEEVTKGERNVAVFWTTTLIKEDSVREAIRGLLMAMRECKGGYPDTPYSNLTEAVKDPAFLIASSIEILRRRFCEI